MTGVGVWAELCGVDCVEECCGGREEDVDGSRATAAAGVVPSHQRTVCVVKQREWCPVINEHERQRQQRFG